MKTTKIALALMSFFFLASCSNDDVESENSTDFISVSQEQKINLNQFNHSISLKGSIQAWVNSNSELVAYSETETHKHIFILQDVMGDMEVNTMFSKITFLDHSFSLIKDSGESILIQIKNKTESEEASTILKQIDSKSDMITVEGSGIVHIWISKKDNNKPELSYASLKLDNGEGDSVFRLANCDSGGSGSTSCATNSGDNGCSVSCGAGTYACCNNATTFSHASCKCKPAV